MVDLVEGEARKEGKGLSWESLQLTLVGEENGEKRWKVGLI